ncbi:MAG: DoxX family protein, partial [Parcubacteria group bacterium GW2011_GWA2_43_17]
KNKGAGNNCPHSLDLALLLIRLGLAAVFLTHGLSKLMNIEGTAGFLGSLGFNGFFAWLVALAETLGGLAMLAGFWTCLAGTALAIVMIFAMVLVKFNAGFVGGWEYDLILLINALAVILAGPGKYALGCGCKGCQMKKQANKPDSAKTAAVSVMQNNKK